MEIEKIHVDLLMYISNHMVVDSPEYGNFIAFMEMFVEKGILAQKKTLHEKFDAMERKGQLKAGQYTALKYICKSSGNNDILNKIEEVEREIKECQARTDTRPDVHSPEDEFLQRKRPRTDTRPDVHSPEDAYLQRKQELKDGLITFYEDKHSTISLSPLFEEKETPLEGFYVMPQMESIEMQGALSRLADIKTTPIKSLSELFKSDSKVHREIYITADAGLGKTAFSKYLAVTWCQAGRSDAQPSKKDHFNALSDFEFLFLVSLRESSGVCYIDDMIKQQIVPHISFSSPLSAEHLQEILHREKYLVILDGLDEWNHPITDCTIFSKDIPHRIARKNCTILTTTRPWKLSVINLKTSQIDRQIELVKLNEDSARQLQFNAFKKINDDFDDEKLNNQTFNFNSEITDNNLEDLKYVPLLLMYLIILWCDKIPLGQSKCGLYTSIIELLLSRTVNKHLQLPPKCELSQTDFPQCFSEHEHCKEYFSLLTALGQLAFHTLFSESREHTLIFDKSIADKFLNENQLKLSHQSGILTQSKVQVKLTKQISQISFSHKSVQEYFCALYMSSQSESDVRAFIQKKCESLQDILDMSVVFVFISGMNGKIISSISHELMSVISGDKITSTYRSTISDNYCIPLKNIQNMYISCIKENPDNNELKLSFQDLIIDGECEHENYKTNLQHLVKQNKNNIKSVSVGGSSSGSLTEILNSFVPTDVNQLQKINCSVPCTEADITRLLLDTVKYLSVNPHGECTMTSDMCKTLQKLPQLEGINISEFKISHVVLDEFFRYLTNRKSLKQIRLDDLSCSDHRHSCDGAMLDFSQHSELRSLVVRSKVPVSQLNINVTSLEECKLEELSKSDLAFSQLPASKLKSLEYRDDISYPNKIETLLNTNINAGKMSLRLIFQMVNIELVSFFRVKLSSSLFRDLVKHVEQLPHSVNVQIRVCLITPKTEYEAAKQYVRTSENFVVAADIADCFCFVKCAFPTTTFD